MSYPSKKSIDRDIPLQGPEKTQRIELGLAILEAKRKPGRVYSYVDIACFAGCTDMAIKLIERKALRKLRLRADRVLRELDIDLTTTRR